MTDGTGRDAPSPWAIPAGGWLQVLRRTWSEAGDDNVGLIAAGVGFYGFLALVPLLGAIVLTYGLVASPETVAGNIRTLATVVPGEAARLVGEQLSNVVSTSAGKKGFGLLLALALALYGAMKGASAIVTALNIAYEEKETRGFVRLNLLALGITVGAVLLALLAALSIAALGHLDAWLPGAPGWLLGLGRLLSYVLMAALGAAAAASLYRYGPDRPNARWTWLTPGSVGATILWLIMTIGFGIYVANFGSYDATYGSLGAVVVLLTWLYLSAYVLLLGAELNSELERQADPAALPDNQPAADRPEPARTLPAAPATPSATPDPVLVQLAAMRGGAKAARKTGLGQAALVPSLLATGGLAQLRRLDRRPWLGLGLLAAGGLLARLNGQEPEPDKRRG